ncbi:MAG: diaminopimelate epimerase [Smithellaceae bacterium]|nr:diaminopimelate epimerase [Smithellaceae bacterium]
MIEFYKMSGSGNDFVLIDNRDQTLAVGDVPEFVKTVCARGVSVGADGLIILENSDKVDFRWRFFNADGSEVEMCGNGGRCAARFAFLKGIGGEKLSFETVAGIIDAEIKDDLVKLRLTDPHDLQINQLITIEDHPFEVNSINTGVPHVVHFVNNLDQYDVFKIGRLIRYHKLYQPAGTNANFVEVIDKHTIRIRTYERGVEDETLACGTGSVASALISSWKGLIESPVDVRVKSGEVLKIYFTKTEKGFHNIYLEGRTRVVYQGLLWDEAYKQNT